MSVFSYFFLSLSLHFPGFLVQFFPLTFVIVVFVGVGSVDSDFLVWFQPPFLVLFLVLVGVVVAVIFALLLLVLLLLLLLFLLVLVLVLLLLPVLPQSVNGYHYKKKGVPHVFLHSKQLCQLKEVVDRTTCS